MMDYIEGTTLYDLKGDEDKDVRNTRHHAVKYLHEGGFVHGDLRGPNILISQDSVSEMSVIISVILICKKVYILDYEMAGSLVDNPIYPPLLNMDLDWPEGVKPGAPLSKDLDYQIMTKLKKEQPSMDRSISATADGKKMSADRAIMSQPNTSAKQRSKSSRQ